MTTRQSARSHRPFDDVTASFTFLAMHAHRFEVQRDLTTSPAETGSRRRQRTVLYSHSQHTRQSSSVEVHNDIDSLIVNDAERTTSRTSHKPLGSESFAMGHPCNRWYRVKKRRNPVNNDWMMYGRDGSLASRCTRFQVTF